MATTVQQLREISAYIAKKRIDTEEMRKLTETSKISQEHGGLRNKIRTSSTPIVQRDNTHLHGSSSASASASSSSADSTSSESTAVNDVKDSEVKAQVTRYEVGGRCRNHVEAIAEKFFTPYMARLNGLTIPAAVDKLFNSHRPLEHEGSRMKEHIASAKKYREKIIAEESKPPSAAPPRPMNVFTACLRSPRNIKENLYKIIEHMASALPGFFQCNKSANKVVYEDSLVEAFGLNDNVTPDDALASIRHKCVDLDLPFHVIENLTPSVPKPTIKEASGINHPLLQDEAVVVRYLGTLALPSDIHFSLTNPPPL